ncbi:MAG: hypothetical protein MI864_00320 [Pseudomonadales bacterium]|nr:hypothetical protein [Pseudomonadales bacterium]
MIFALGTRVYIPSVYEQGTLVAYRGEYYFIEMDNGSEATMLPRDVELLQ